jgi:hypothetical protein
MLNPERRLECRHEGPVSVTSASNSSSARGTMSIDRTGPSTLIASAATRFSSARVSGMCADTRPPGT